MSLAIADIRKRFPQVQHLDKKKEVYLDSAATALKIDLVIDSLTKIYKERVSNVHRGESHLSLEATADYEKAREQAAHFLNAKSLDEVVFTSGTTFGLNLLANALEHTLQEGDEILISEMEHHSNILPWKVLAEKKNLQLKIIKVNPDGTLDLESFKSLLSSKTKIFSIVHISNVTGVINPIEEMIAQAKKVGACTIVDAAQSVPYINIDVQKIDCDFLVFSGHKIFAPSGTGVLYGKKEALSQLSPFLVGGGMIKDVSFEKVIWADKPFIFEAGTPFIEGAITLGEVLSFFRENINCEEVLSHSSQLVEMAILELSKIPEVKLIGSPKNKSSIVAFVIDGFNSSDVAFMLTQQKIALRSGHHCCMPLMQKLKLDSGVIRASFAVYNTEKDVKALADSITKTINILKGS